EAFKSGAAINEVFYTPEFPKSEFWCAIYASAKPKEIPMVEISPTQAAMIRSTQHTQGVFAVLPLLPRPNPALDHSQLLKTPILVLDDITDPGNMGTLLRIADWFGMPTIWISERSADLYNPKVVRAAAGAHFHVKNLYQGDLNPLSGLLTEHRIICLGATIHGEHLGLLTLPDDNWALVLGNEARGLSLEWQKRLAREIKVPGAGAAESLNVSVAAGIILYQLRIMKPTGPS
ncbi:MAG: RNA methyltransferase, partial [Candidatus Neomarinimicrobiota bacterium]